MRPGLGSNQKIICIFCLVLIFFTLFDLIVRNKHTHREWYAKIMYLIRKNPDSLPSYFSSLYPLLSLTAIQNIFKLIQRLGHISYIPCTSAYLMNFSLNGGIYSK